VSSCNDTGGLRAPSARIWSPGHTSPPTTLAGSPCSMTTNLHSPDENDMFLSASFTRVIVSREPRMPPTIRGTAKSWTKSSFVRAVPPVACVPDRDAHPPRRQCTTARINMVATAVSPPATNIVAGRARRRMIGICSVTLDVGRSRLCGFRSRGIVVTLGLPRTACNCTPTSRL
jgi:hypothetical protein